MLNPFPQFMFLSFFAPTLLRITVAVVFAMIAFRLYKTRAEVARGKVPFIGTPGMAFVIIAIIIDLLLAVMLFLGWSTQLAALVGTIVSLKHAWAAGRYPLWSPKSRSVYILAAIICISLLVTGAGAYAMDLPL
jgi:uncharacterized membrane protein YphA (DoxX/SURF4 family)